MSGKAYLVTRKVPHPSFVTVARVCEECKALHSPREFRIEFIANPSGPCDGCDDILEPSEPSSEADLDAACYSPANDWDEMMMNGEIDGR